MTSSIREVVQKAYGVKQSSHFSFRSTLFQLPDFKDINGEELLRVGLSTRARVLELSLLYADVVVVFCGDGWNGSEVQFVAEATAAMRWIYRRAGIGFRRLCWRKVAKSEMSKGLQEVFDEVGESLTLGQLSKNASEFCDDFAWEFKKYLPKKAIPIYMFKEPALARQGDASKVKGIAADIGGDDSIDWQANGDWGVVIAYPSLYPPDGGGPPATYALGTLTVTAEVPPIDEFGSVMPAVSAVVPMGNLMAHELGHFFGLLHVCTEFGVPTNECSDLPGWDEPCPELASAQAAIDNFMNPIPYFGSGYQIVKSQASRIQKHKVLQGPLEISPVGQ